MKTENIIAAFQNATTPAARLAAWQSRPLASRRRSLADYYDKAAALAERRRTRINSNDPELSGPILWVDEKSPEVLDSYAGRDHGLDHVGWFTDDFQDETLETYAVILVRFPRLVFYAVKSAYGDGLRVDLAEWEEIDFAGCENDHDADAARSDAAREMVRSCDSSTRRQAEDEQEFQRKDQIERDIEDNKTTLKSLRVEIRAIVHELKTLCPSTLATEYPAAGKAVLSALRSLLGKRRELVASNLNLASSL